MPGGRKWRDQGNGIGGCPRRVRRFLEPCILLLLGESDGHGYSLVEELKQFGFDRAPVDSSVIYRTLRRLEAGGLVSSAWDTDTTAGPPRRVYRLTEAGEQYLAGWVADLEETAQVIRSFITRYHEHLAAQEEDRRAEARAV